MMPNPPMPDDDPTSTPDVPDLGREDDMQRSIDDGDADRAASEDDRSGTADERTGPEGAERPRIEPDDATPTEDPGTSPI